MNTYSIISILDKAWYLRIWENHKEQKESRKKEGKMNSKKIETGSMK